MQVVVTSYEVLRQEVYYSPENRILGALRHKKRYMVPESPLLQVSCLDYRHASTHLQAHTACNHVSHMTYG